MSQLKGAKLKFAASGSPDVIGYKLYIELSPNQVTYNSQAFDLGNNVIDGYVETDLADIEGMTTLDGVYNIGVTAIDDAGNESCMTMLDNVPLDFLAPDPPGPLSFV